MVSSRTIPSRRSLFRRSVSTSACMYSKSSIETYFLGSIVAGAAAAAPPNAADDGETGIYWFALGWKRKSWLGSIVRGRGAPWLLALLLLAPGYWIE